LFNSQKKKGNDYMKSLKHILYTAIVLAGATALQSCDGELEEINRNPNATEDPQPAYLLTSVEYSSADLIWGSTANYNSTLLWAQHWAKIQYTEPDCYNVTNSSFSSTWNSLYATIITDLNAIIASDYGNDNYTAIATIWRSWAFLQLTNFYGDIPYTEFAQSVTPAYDTQESVLRGLLTELSDAAGKLSAAGGTVTGDLIYGGDVNSWKQFANALRLRIALEIADRDEATAKQVISSLWSNRNSVINSNSLNAKFAFSSSPLWNPWASAFSSRDDQRVSKTLVDKLLELNDPRLAVFAQLPEDKSVTTYVGAANGLSADAANNQGFYKLSRPGSAFLEDNSPALFYNYAEVLFIFAESAARGWISADAASLYNDAIAASLRQYGASDAEVSAYLAQESVAFDSTRWYESIGWQKWIAYYGQGPEAFTDWRRLGYPKLVPGPDTTLDAGVLPRRFFYPVTEQTLNGEQYKLAVAHQGADEITTRLWFDVADKKR
jgi:hypothetical protein